MEARKEALRALAVCRFCLRRGGSLSSIYGKTLRKSPVSLPLQIMACVNIEVFPSDGMPSQICERCVFFMEQCYQFKQVCRSADETLLQFMQTGEDPEPVQWPQELLETAAVRSAVEGVKRGRAAAEEERQVKVRVSTGSEVESDDDDVLNIKIETEHGEEGGVPARIKVTQRDGKLLITEEGEETREQDAEDDEETEAEMGKRVIKPVEGKYPCSECHRSFPLRQQLQLHMKRQHRERNVQCPQCPDKFYSKYDLVTHLTRHSDEMPFECVACSRQFKRFNLLKRHEKVAHKDSSQYACKDCTMSFLSMEELQAHASRHSQYESRPYQCPASAEGEDKPCGRRFQTRSSLMRHLDHVHNTSDLRHTCNYCPQRFSTAQRLARHIKEHAGQRPYPCKYCSKSFLKSHHYTRHVRAKHSRSSLARHEMAATEVYNCSECRDTFTTQEALAYHEAEHATRSLTCPLCMAHFGDVDAVTEHIKLHADQEMQFLCDFCDLVFVSEEALETHSSERHADERKLSQLMNNSTEVEAENEESNTAAELLSLGVQDAAELKPTIPQELTLVSEDMLGTDNEMATYTELSTVDTLHMARLQSVAPIPAAPRTPPAPRPAAAPVVNDHETGSLKTAGILRKAEEVKRRVEQERAQHCSPPKKLARPASALIQSPTPVKSPASTPALTPAQSPALTPAQSPAPTPAQSPAPVRKQQTPEKKHAPPPAKNQQAPTPVDKERRIAEKPTLTEKANGVEKKEREKEKERHKEPSDREKDRTQSDKEKERTKDSSERDRERSERSEKDKARPRKQEEQSDRGKERAKQTSDKEKEREKERGKEKENEESKAETPSDKSLRLLERDLLELKRTSSASRPSEMSDKSIAQRRGRAPNVTPAKQKLDASKSSGEKMSAPTPQSTIRRRVAPHPRERDNREKERREERERDRDGAKNRRDERERDAARISKDTSKDTKEKETNHEPTTETPRRSSRTARIKDYAKMIRDSHDSASSDFEESDESSEESPPAPAPVQDGQIRRPRGRPRRDAVVTQPTSTSSATASKAPETAPTPPSTPTPTATDTPTPRRRGRPPSTTNSTSVEAKRRKSKSQEEQNPVTPSAQPEVNTTPAVLESVSNTPTVPSPTPTSAATQVQSPTQQTVPANMNTLTPVPASMIKSLPPGVRPLPLPAQLKTVSGSICEMKMGEKVVKVQKIIMTKAEVEAMSKKGLLEMKHGTMVLKQGFKLPPSSDPAAIRSTLARAASAPAAPSPASTPASAQDSPSAVPSEPMEGATSGPVSSDTPEPMET